MIALDKRMKSDGLEVLELGQICVENGAFEQANRCFQHVIDLGPEQVNFYEAQIALLNSRFVQVTQLRNFNTQEIEQCITDFELALERLGKGRATFQVSKQLADSGILCATNRNSNSRITRFDEASRPYRHATRSGKDALS